MLAEGRPGLGLEGGDGGGGRRLREGGEEASAGSPAPEVAPCGAMAAPGARIPARLLLALQSRPARRALHDAAPPRDVLLFEHERGRFFAVLGLFCAGQGVFWASLAIAALARPPAPARPPDTESPDRGRLDLRSALWRYGLALGCGTIGKCGLASGHGDKASGSGRHTPPCSSESKGLPTLQATQEVRRRWQSASAKPLNRLRLSSASHSMTLRKLLGRVFNGNAHLLRLSGEMAYMTGV